MFIEVWYNNRRDLLQKKNGIDIESETEVDVEAWVWKLFVVVWRQTRNFIVTARENELSILDGRQPKKDGIAWPNGKVLTSNLIIKIK